MEVVVKMEAGDKGDMNSVWKTLMIGRFAMVCRDSKTQKAKRVPSLIVESEEEKALWAIGTGEQDTLLIQIQIADRVWLK